MNWDDEIYPAMYKSCELVEDSSNGLFAETLSGWMRTR